MKIHSMEFENHTTGQKIEKIDFDSLNLLVGISGAGKTLILKTVSTYVLMALHTFQSSFTINFAGHFKIIFSIFGLNQSSNQISKKVIWEIDTVPMNELFRQTNSAFEYGISKEILIVNDKKIVLRDQKHLLINDKDTANISSDKSVLSVFNTPDDIQLIRSNFFKMIPYYTQINPFIKLSLNNFNATKKFIQDNNIYGLGLRLFMHNFSALKQIGLMKIYDKNIFENFLLKLNEIFPSIEDVGVDSFGDENQLSLFINERGKIIPKEYISGGVLKTIYILASAEFSTDHAVILLDELENSLGVNCLDGVTDYIVEKSSGDTMQFILTSHHPYIINNISAKNWRIISQNAGVISSKSANEVGIDTKNNRQEQFFQLINYMERQF